MSGPRYDSFGPTATEEGFDSYAVPSSSASSSSSSSSSGRRHHSTPSSSSSSHWRRGAVFLTMVAVVALVAVTNKDRVMSSFNRAYKQASFYYTLEDPLDAVATNEYSYRNLNMFAYPFLENALLLEPWREGTITVTPKKEGCILAYTIVPDEQWQGYGVDLSHTMSGSDDGEYVFFVTPTKTGKYTMKVTESCGGLAGRSMEKTVWVKYVKRELQSLNDYDREEFLDVYHKMWEVSTTEGKLKYGDAFRSVYYFSMIHNDAGANHICDEYHEGTGFLNNHLQLGNYFEQSMRMINPRVSLHYLEYSKYFSDPAYANHMANPLDGGNWTEIMTEKYFGSNDPWTGAIRDGRWAYTPVPVIDQAFLDSETIGRDEHFFPDEKELWLSRTTTHLPSPYGLLRSPWNFDPHKFTTRWNNVNQLPSYGVSEHAMKPFRGSTCSDYQIFITQHAVNHALQMYLETAEDAVHGYVHKTIGGFGGERAHAIDIILRDQYGLTPTQIYYVAQATHKFVKTYISMLDFDMEPIGYITPLMCSNIPWNYEKDMLMSEAFPGEDTGPICECNSYYMESEERVDSLIAIYFNHFMGDDDTIFGFDLETKKEIMQLICSRMSMEGDMAGSGAAHDPLFWVAHGAVERLFQRVVFDNSLTNLNYVSSVRGTCSGHDANGKKAWLKGLVYEDPSIKPETLTNAELAEMLNPLHDHFRDWSSFVYEDKDWPWCEGFDTWLDPNMVSKDKIIPPSVEDAPGPSDGPSGRVVPTAPSQDSSSGTSKTGGTGGTGATVPVRPPQDMGRRI